MGASVKKLVKWKDLSLTPKIKELTLPGYAKNIRVEFGGIYSDRDIYLHWSEYGSDKCKKIASTRWRLPNLEKVEKSLIVSDILVCDHERIQHGRSPFVACYCLDCGKEI